MSELETVIIMGVVIISFIINIIQHIYMNRLYKTTMMWKDQSKYLQKELETRNKIIRTLEGINNDENND